MLTWIKNFDKFEARFRQFGGWRRMAIRSYGSFAGWHIETKL